MPQFQDHQRPTIGAAERATAARPALSEVHATAVEAASQRYAAEVAAR